MTGVELSLVIGAIFAGCTGIITALATMRTSASKAQVDALTATVATLQSENKRQNERIEHLEQEVEEKDELIKERDNSIDLLKEWAEMLVKQVKALGGDPVKMPERRKAKVSPQ